ncbi:MAG: response regulator [Calditrichales bacterium]|nr:MAG: response regulator [Calditrichales bacterium]
MSSIKRLLIVDDEETLTYSLYQSFILSQNNYEVVTAASGDEAVKKMEKSPFDLVLTDIRMPGMDGLELLQHIKSTYPKTEVIVMTAFGSSDKKEEALEKGARFYIEKPFEIKEIKQLVMELLA